eukprot:SAG31_NODE_17577_length_666_cov_0.719577_2_plen_98_part_00
MEAVPFDHAKKAALIVKALLHQLPKHSAAARTTLAKLLATPTLASLLANSGHGITARWSRQCYCQHADLLEPCGAQRRPLRIHLHLESLFATLRCAQ